MVPRGEMTVSKGMVSREWGLWVGGRSVVRGFLVRAPRLICNFSTLSLSSRSISALPSSFYSLLSFVGLHLSLLLHRLVSIARGEQTYFDPSGLPTATEGCKSNALMRCCKDLGIASELW